MHLSCVRCRRSATIRPAQLVQSRRCRSTVAAVVPPWSVFSRSAARLLRSTVMATTVIGTIQTTTLIMAISSRIWKAGPLLTGWTAVQLAAVEFSGGTSWCGSSLPTAAPTQPARPRTDTASSRVATSTRALLMLCVRGQIGARALPSVATVPDRGRTCCRTPRPAAGRSAHHLRMRPSPRAATRIPAALPSTVLASGAGGRSVPVGTAPQPVTTMSSPTRRTEARATRVIRPT